MKRPAPPLVAWTAFAGMLVTHRLVPIKQMLPFPWNLLGGVPLLVGAALAAVSLWIFHRHHTTPTPFGRPRRLVTSGPFRLSRNPMYLGILLAFSGIATLLGTVTPWLVLLALGVALDRSFIRPEEQQLAATFEEAYTQYKTQVRRWI